MTVVAHRGRIAHCLSEPGDQPDDSSVEYFDDGLMVIDNGHISALAPAESLVNTLSDDIEIVEHGNRLIIPGMIDCHVHYAQTDVIACYGTQLLNWLEDYAFPAEMRFADIAHANACADFFVEEMLKNGTTSALVFATVHPHSVDAIFAAANKRHMRIAAGKVLMDQHCPTALQDTAASGYRESRELLERWHHQDRLDYAITPRFAVTSSQSQLAAAGKLADEFPSAMIHTHLAENLDEARWVRELYPHARSYLDVYQQAGLLRERAVFAHCIHLDEPDYEAMAKGGGAMAFCPTSNLFLGSGLFDLARARQHGIQVGLGTDVGGGTSFSLLQTMNEAYKVLQLQQVSLSSVAALYLATLGAAKSLCTQDKVGNFEVGKEADFVVLDSAPTRLLERRLAQANTLSDSLFSHMMLGDDRSVDATYIMGELAYAKPQRNVT